MVICAVVGCGNRSGRDKKSFFRLPCVIENQGARTKELSKQRQQAWLAKIKREDLRQEQFGNTRVCSDHFLNGAPCKLYDINNPNWAPSLNLVFEETSVSTMKAKSERYERAIKRKRVTAASATSVENSCNDTDTVNPTADTITELSSHPSGYNEVDVQTDLTFSTMFDLPLRSEVQELRSELDRVKADNESLKKELKSKVMDLGITEKDFEGNNVKVLYYTGLTTWELLKALYAYTESHLKTQSALSPFQQLLMTLMRLRLNLQGQDLAYRFQISKSTVSRIFLHALNVLFVRLKPLILWPDRESLRKTMPMVFRKYYPSCVVIIDCFEIFLDRPTNLLARAQTFSSYKHHNTVKYLIGITPQGTVSFISEGWGGRTSDKYITEHTSLLNKLLPGDTVLADRGFDIGDSVGMFMARLAIPAFTKNKKQYSITVEQTRNIANVRIHVERVIGNVRKKYSILNATQPIDFVMSDASSYTTLDKIVYVSCALINICDSVVPFE